MQLNAWEDDALHTLIRHQTMLVGGMYAALKAAQPKDEVGWNCDRRAEKLEKKYQKALKLRDYLVDLREAAGYMP